jgi:hypothetical protein
VLDGFNAKPQRRKEEIFALILALALIAVTGCKPNPDPDRAKLDNFLSVAHIDRFVT